METIVSGVLFAIDNIADECFTWVPPDARWRRPRAYIYVYYLCVYIYIDIYIQFQFHFVYSQPIRIEAEKGRTLN